MALSVDVPCHVEDAKFYQKYLTIDMHTMEGTATLFVGSEWQCWCAHNRFVAVADRTNGLFDLRLLRQNFEQKDMRGARVFLTYQHRSVKYLSWPNGGHVFAGEVAPEDVIPARWTGSVADILQHYYPHESDWILCFSNAEQQPSDVRTV